MSSRRRKLVALLGADVVGFSSLIEADELSTVERLQESRRLFAERIAKRGGQVVDSAGDGVLAAFESAIEAVECAVEIQKELRTWNASASEPTAMTYRIGVNLGDVLEEEGRLYGDGVNVTARLESLAVPGGICVSGKVFDEVEGRVSCTFEFLGEKRVKNIDRPVRVYAVLVGEDLRIALLGVLEIHRGGAVVRLPMSNKCKALLAYLVLSDRPHRRERLCALLWDVADDPRAALRWCLSKLRPLVDEPGRPRIVADRETVSFDAEGASLDVRDLRWRLAGGAARLSTEDLIALAETFRGELLEGLDLPDYHDFRAWCIGQREEVRRLQSQVLQALLERVAHDPSRGLAWARLWSRLAPHDPSAKASLERALLSVQHATLEEDACSGETSRETRRAPEPPVADARPAPPPLEPSDREATREDLPSLAVLPFRNPTGTEHDYFSRGIAEDVATALGKLADLRVIAPSAAFGWDAGPFDPRHAGAELGVRYVLTGSVRRAGDVARLTAQLVEAATGRQVWAERYDRTTDDEVFAVQDELTREIVTALEIQLTLGEQARLWRRRSRSLEAYAHYSRGMDFYNRFTQATNAQARHEFERALEIDPGFPAAHHYLGWVHCSDAGFGWSEDAEASLAKAWDFAERAIALDDSLADAYAVRAYVHLLRRDYDAAIVEAERAVAKNPSGATVCHVLAMASIYAGSPEEAIGLEKQALRLSPLAQDNFRVELGHAYCLSSRFAEALSPLEAAVRSKPYWFRARLFLAVALAESGACDRAQEQVREILRTRPWFSLKKWSRSQLYRDPEDLDRLVGALRRAGFPD